MYLVLISAIAKAIIIGFALSIPIGTASLFVLREVYDRGSDAGYESVGAPITFDLVALCSLLFLVPGAFTAGVASIGPNIRCGLSIVAILILVVFGLKLLFDSPRPAPQSPRNYLYFKTIFAGLPTLANVFVSVSFLISLIDRDIIVAKQGTKIVFVVGVILADFFSWVFWIYLATKMKSKGSFSLIKINRFVAIVFFAAALRIIWLHYC